VGVFFRGGRRGYGPRTRERTEKTALPLKKKRDADQRGEQRDAPSATAGARDRESTPSQHSRRPRGSNRGGREKRPPLPAGRPFHTCGSGLRRLETRHKPRQRPEQISDRTPARREQRCASNGDSKRKTPQHPRHIAKTHSEISHAKSPTREDANAASSKYRSPHPHTRGGQLRTAAAGPAHSARGQQTAEQGSYPAENPVRHEILQTRHHLLPDGVTMKHVNPPFSKKYPSVCLVRGKRGASAPAGRSR